MKLWGLFIILGLMGWSWQAFYPTQKSHVVSEQTLIEIQDGLQDQIFEVISQNLPHVSNMVFQKFWIEDLDPHSIRAHFLLTFDQSLEDGLSQIEREGSITLVRADKTSPEQIWMIDSVDLKGEVIHFEEGLRLISTPPKDQ